MANNKTYAVLGLGIFGSTIAMELSKYNNEVIAVDRDMSCVERISDSVTQAVRADFTDIEQLKAIGIQDCDVAVVAAGDLLEESIMGVMNLKELGVPYVIAKAKNKKYMEILLKVGADRVVRPEKEMGERIAKQLVSDKIVDLIDLDEKYSIVEIMVPSSWIGYTLRELNLRAKYGINVVGIRKTPNEALSISPAADYRMEKEDCLLVIADNEVFSYFDEMIKE